MKATLIRTQNHKDTRFWLFDLKGNEYISLDKAQLCREISNFRSFNERTREQAFRRFLRSAHVADAGEPPRHVQNFSHLRVAVKSYKALRVPCPGFCRSNFKDKL